MLRVGRGNWVVLVAAVAVAVAACSVGRAGPPGETETPATLTAQTGSTRATAPSRPGTLLPQSPVPGGSGAALNSRLLSQARAPIGAADLPVGPGDLIEISVFEVDELSKLKLRIPIRGTITLPLIGQIRAAGRTAIELEDDIRERLEQKYMHEPQVSVFVHEHKSQRISVIGAVRRGGVYTITSPLRVADALALAEGLTDDADHTVYLIRRVPAGTAVQTEDGVAPPKLPLAAGERRTEQVMAPIDLELLADGRDELNVALEAGDVVHVPRAGSYYVGGSVERPGSFLLKGKTTAEQAIMAAGGPRAVADWEDVRIYRIKPGGDREILAFNLSEFEKGNGHTAPELQKNDVLIVGKSSAKAFWFGILDFIRGMFSISRGL